MGEGDSERGRESGRQPVSLSSVFSATCLFLERCRSGVGFVQLFV